MPCRDTGPQTGGASRRTLPSGLIIRLRYTHQRFDGEREHQEYSVVLDWTPCNYAGARCWFICPARGCSRRVAVLYSSSMFMCRHEETVSSSGSLMIHRQCPNCSSALVKARRSDQPSVQTQAPLFPKAQTTKNTEGISDLGVLDHLSPGNCSDPVAVREFSESLP
jgi:hypothetical protein